MIDYIQDNRSQKKLENILFTIAIFEFVFGLVEVLSIIFGL